MTATPSMPQPPRRRRLYWPVIVLLAATTVLLAVLTMSYRTFPADQEAALNELTALKDVLFRIQHERNRLHTMTQARFDALFPLIRRSRRHVRRLDALLKHREPQLAAEFAQTAATLNRRLHRLQRQLSHQAVALNSHAHFSRLGELCLRERLTRPHTQHDALVAFQHYYAQMLTLPFRGDRGNATLLAQSQALTRAMGELPENSTACRMMLRHGDMLARQLTALYADARHSRLDDVISRLDALQRQLDTAIRSAMTLYLWLIATAILIGLAIIGYALYLLQREARFQQTLAHQNASLQHLNRIHETLSIVNHEIVHAREEDALVRAITDAFVRHLRLPAALAFRMPPHGEQEMKGRSPFHVRLLTPQSSVEALLQKLRISLHPDHPDYLRPFHSLFTQASQVSPPFDLQRDDQLAAWRPLCRYGLNTFTVLFLRPNNGVRYYILLLHPPETAFCNRARQLLENTVDEAVFALNHLHSERTRRQQENFLRLTEAALNTHEGLAWLTPEGEIHRINDAFQQITGYQRAELLRRSLVSLFDTPATLSEILQTLRTGHNRWQGNVLLRRRDGSLMPTLCTFMVVQLPDSQQRQLLLMVQDLRRIRELENKLHESHTLDPITKLPNRQTLIQQLSRMITQDSDAPQTGIVAIVNIRNFATYTDSLGIHASDRLLQEIARRFKQIGVPHLTGRDRGDEFIIAPLTLFDNQQATLQHWEQLHREISAALARPFDIHGARISLVEFCVGLTFYTTRSGLNFDAILEEAETAVRQAVEQNQPLVFYQTMFNQRARRRLKMREALAMALEQQAFSLHYQPIMSAGGQRMALCEALLRWTHEGQPVSPAEFVPLLEESPALMHRIGRWLLRRAIDDIARLNRMLPDGAEPIGVSINLSGIQLQDARLLPALCDQLAHTGLPPALVTLEITESALIDDHRQALDFLARCREIGVEIAIDDFGTGYSSLEYLQKFNADKIKLDRAFVTPLDPDDPASQVIPRMTISMAHNLGARLVAEGVETPTQARLLQQMQCDYLQGYLFARGLPFDELVTFAKEHLRDQDLADRGHTGQRQDDADPSSSESAAVP